MHAFVQPLGIYMRRYLVFAFAFSLVAVNAAGLDYYQEGAICDKKSGFCVDGMGVSIALTKMYLGDRLEEKLMFEINKVGVQNFDTITFSLQGGLTCDTRVKTCWTNRYDKKVDVKATRTLFGK